MINLRYTALVLEWLQSKDESAVVQNPRATR
jgi:hypothetical protein